VLTTPRTPAAFTTTPSALVPSVNPTGTQTVRTELEDAQGIFILVLGSATTFIDRISLDQYFARAVNDLETY
jgi:hypothetical protein